MRVVGDLPRMTVRVDEDAGIAAPEGLAAFAGDPRAGGPSFPEHRVDLLGRARVVRRRDAAPAAAVLDAAVGRELVPAPEGEHAAAGLEEHDAHFRVGVAVPAERLVEGAGATEIGDAERDQADPLLHEAIKPDAEDPMPLGHG